MSAVQHTPALPICKRLRRPFQATPERLEAASLIDELHEALGQLLAVTDDPENNADEEESVFPYARRVLAKARGEA